MEKEFKTVAKFNDAMRAEIAAGALRANGIEAQLFNDNSPFPGFAKGTGIAVKVNAADYEEAKKLLASSEND